MSVEKIFLSFPIIQVDSKHYLRKFSYDDMEAYYNYISDSEVNKYVPKECIPQSLELTKAEIDYCLDLYKYKRSIYWALARLDNNRLIGSCGFNYWNRDHSRAEISYDLAKEYWGKGIMTKAAKAVISYAFTHMQLHRIEATVTPTNVGSLKVLKKIGFQKEGVLRQQKLLHGKFYDAVMLSLLQSEYLRF